MQAMSIASDPVSSTGNFSKVPTKSRAYTFQIRFTAEKVESLGDALADWNPDVCPTALLNSYSCGSVAKAEYEHVNKYTFHGYAEFKNQANIGKVREWLGNDVLLKAVNLKDRDTHIAAALNPEGKMESYDLLHKDWENGSSSRLSERGSRNDYEEIRDILKKEGMVEGRKIVAHKYPGLYMRYPNGIEALADIVQPTTTDKEFTPRPWQEALIEQLKAPAHERWIFWFYDEQGGMGKSRLTTYLCCEMNAIELSGRSQDIAFAYQSQPIVIFDISRPTKLELCNDLYTCAESLKNGRIFSSKYMSKTKSFKCPHVVFFSNAMPPVGVWSADRLQFIQLSNPAPFSAVSVLIDSSPDDSSHEESTGVANFNKSLTLIMKRREDEAKAKRDREDDT